MPNQTTTGILLVGTHPWTNGAFDSLVARTLLPIAHRPLIWYGLSWLHRQGVRDVAVCGNRETRLLQSRLTRHVPANMIVSYRQDPMPRGAAGSARDAAFNTDAETFVIADGTTIPAVDLTELLQKHHDSDACVTVVVHSESRGNAAIHVPSGIYIFSRRAFNAVPACGFCDIKETLLPKLYAAGERVLTYEAAGATPRVLDESTYRAVNEWMIERLVNSGNEQDGYSRRGNALVHRDAMVAADAVVVGPALIGPGARIASSAVLIGPVSIGRDARVGRGAVISRSAVWRRSHVGDGAVVDQSIVADDAVIDARAEILSDVVVSDSVNSKSDWVTRQVLTAPRRPRLEAATRVVRLVFGAGWLRSPAAQ